MKATFKKEAIKPVQLEEINSKRIHCHSVKGT
jgi:hypothetical protein